MSWFYSKSEEYRNLEIELEILANRYAKLDSSDSCSVTELNDLEKEMDKIRLELRCIEAGL